MIHNAVLSQAQNDAVASSSGVRKKTVSALDKELEKDAVYRKQLVEEARLCVKLVIAQSPGEGNIIEDNSSELINLCLTLEKIFRHGLKGTNAISLGGATDSSSDTGRYFFGRKDYWNFIETLARFYEPARNSIQSVSQLSHVQTVEVRLWPEERKA
jgi:hypothetical protein